MKKNIRLFQPYIGKEELEQIKDSFDKTWIGLGNKVSILEENFKEYFNEPEGECIALNSATAALHLALNVYDFPKGSEVLIPNITFVSTSHAVLYNGLKPVFVDVEEETFQMSVSDLEKKITKKTVAIIPVHFGGHYCDMNTIMRLAKKKKLKVIEDCANCLGGKYDNKYLGTIGDIGCFSFEEKKNMTSGDGGLIFTKDKSLVVKLNKLRWVGINKDTWKRIKSQNSKDEDPYHWYYEVDVLGYKYNMNDLSACIAIEQLKKLDKMNSIRENLISYYLEKLGKSEFYKPTFPYDLNNSGYWLFSLRVKDKNNLINHLKKNGIATGVHFMPNTLHPLYHEYDKNDTPISYNHWEEILTLPLHCYLENEDIDYITTAIKSFYEN